MHIVHKNIKELSRLKNTSEEDNGKDVWYRFNMYCMSLLVNTRMLFEFDNILEDIVICLLSKKQTKMCLVTYNKLSG